MSNVVSVCSLLVHWEASWSREVDWIWDRTAGNRDSVTANTRNTLTAYSHIWRGGEQGTHGCVNCSLDKHEVLLVSLLKVVLLYEILSWMEVQYSQFLHSLKHEQLCVLMHACVRGKICGNGQKFKWMWAHTVPASCLAFWVLTLVWDK